MHMALLGSFEQVSDLQEVPRVMKQCPRSGRDKRRPSILRVTDTCQRNASDRASPCCYELLGLGGAEYSQPILPAQPKAALSVLV